MQSDHEKKGNAGRIVEEIYTMNCPVDVERSSRAESIACCDSASAVRMWGAIFGEPDPLADTAGKLRTPAIWRSDAP